MEPGKQAEAENPTGPEAEKTPAKRAPVKRAAPAKRAQKATPAKKAAPVKRAPKVPDESSPAAKPLTVVAVPAQEHFEQHLVQRGTKQSEHPIQRFESLAEKLLAEPTRTPEILALAAVEAPGPKARDWADRTRATYPAATREAVAGLAVRRFARAAGLRGAAGALAGTYAPIAVTAGILVTHAELVLHLAAAFGVDPEDPRRAEDLLRLASPGLGLGPIAAGLVLKRVFPGLGLVTTVLGARSTTEAVALRATRFYRDSQLSQAAGSSA